MAYEKSCGSVLYRIHDELRILVIKQARNGNWSFPKGHVENDETEKQTAIREVLEEVGINITPMEGFREVIRYSPKAGTEKDVVYFISNPALQRVKLQRSEVSDYKWLRPQEALKTLTFHNDREVLKKALEFLRENNKI